MTVTEIVEISRNRSKVYVDQEFAFVLYKGELSFYDLKVGKEVSLKSFQEIEQVLLPKRAKLRAMNLLQKRSYTEQQLRDKLMEGYYKENVIDEAISYMKSFHYIDDFQYTQDYISCYEGRKPKKKIELELLQKGISKEILMTVFQKYAEENGEQDEVTMINTLLEKKHYSEDMNLKDKRKIFAFLLRRGFSIEKIQEAMRE